MYCTAPRSLIDQSAHQTSMLEVENVVCVWLAVLYCTGGNAIEPRIPQWPSRFERGREMGGMEGGREGGESVSQLV